jgi:hypothetical protein
MAKTSEVVSEPPIEIQRTGKRPTAMDEYDRARQERFAEGLRSLRGKVRLDIDLDELRGRRS